MPISNTPPVDNSLSPANHNSLACPHCSDHRVVSYGAKKGQIITDLPRDGNPTRIVIDRSRYRCKSCRRTFLEPLEGVEEGRGITKRLTAYIEDQALVRSFVAVAKETGVSEATVRNVFNAYQARVKAGVHFQTPDFLVLEPITLLNKPRYLVGNVRMRTVIDVLDADTPAAVAAYIEQIPDRNAVQFVLMDTNNEVRSKVWELLPMAQTIVGSRPLIRMVADFCEEIRRRERERSFGYSRRVLAQDRAILRLRMHELSPRQLATLERWRYDQVDMLKAYLLKENFCKLFDLTGRKTARKAFEFWSMDMETTYREPDCPLSLPNWTIDSVWLGEYLRWFELPSVRKYEQEVAPLLEVLPKVGRKYAFEAVRAKILSMEEGRTDKGIRIGTLVSVIAEEINTILRLSVN